MGYARQNIWNSDVIKVIECLIVQIFFVLNPWFSRELVGIFIKTNPVVFNERLNILLGDIG